jgi:hypothetical protein
MKYTRKIIGDLQIVIIRQERDALWVQNNMMRNWKTISDLKIDKLTKDLCYAELQRDGHKQTIELLLAENKGLHEQLHLENQRGVKQIVNSVRRYLDDLVGEEK